MRIDMTDRFVAGAKCGSGGRAEFFDTKAKGLSLRVSSDHKAWSFSFTSPKDGKRSRIALGSYPALPLAKARTSALEMRAKLREGEDPRYVAKPAAAMLVRDLVKAYCTDPEKLELRSIKQIVRRMEADVLPVIGDVKVSAAHKRDITRVLDPIRKRGAPIQARIVYQNLRAIFRWAVQRGDLDHSPCEGMKAPSDGKARERTLSDNEIRTFWQKIDDILWRSDSCSTILKLCLLTAQRVGEVSGIARAEVDLDANLWRIPGTRTKNGRPHVVPLSAVAAAMFKDVMARSSNSAYVFPSPVAEKDMPLPAPAVSRSLGRALQPHKKTGITRMPLEHFTAHDLRRTALTGMAKLGVSPTVLSNVANHISTSKGGVTLGVYVHHTYDDEKRDALDRWAAQVIEIGIDRGIAGQS